LLICSELTFGRTLPETSNDSYTTYIDKTLVVDLVLISFRIKNIEYLAGQTATVPEGSIRINTDGSLSYSPSLGFEGSVPLIVYTISDGTSSA
jgi:hypothetical protein